MSDDMLQFSRDMKTASGGDFRSNTGLSTMQNAVALKPVLTMSQ